MRATCSQLHQRRATPRCLTYHPVPVTYSQTSRAKNSGGKQSHARTSEQSKKSTHTERTQPSISFAQTPPPRAPVARTHAAPCRPANQLVLPRGTHHNSRAVSW
eukprot:7150957-Prymnesium_polylepis.1